ncbi:hypothetical protein [Proteiniphilum sp. UBA5384]|uniref:hypothetical protein n=1 Tax=Proteiniphilum sp. UBA5384 TaxID=1947279 RepID=UPI0025E66056|nr:hypothetical protein [Proteiniphilum sp. UBA5384]
MKRKFLFSSVAAFLILFVGYGCSDDSLSDWDVQRMIDNSLDGQWQIVNVKINGPDWIWSEDEFKGGYKATVNLPELDEKIFDEGAVIAYYKFNSDAKTTLPYAKVGKMNDGGTYTETYSCYFQLENPSSVATFYLESTDMGTYDPYPPTAEFQIILIW